MGTLRAANMPNLPDTRMRCSSCTGAAVLRSSGLARGVAPVSEPVSADQACVLGQTEPAARYVGLLCRRHYHRLDASRREIEELYALRDDVLIPGPSGD